MSNEKSDDLDLRCYSAAGELYGVLQGKLAYGELTMRAGTFVGSATPTAIAYRWSFVDGDRKFSLEEWVPFETLASSSCIEAFAEHLAALWNHQRELSVQPCD